MRKNPRQQRSRQTVAAAIEAAEQLIAERGWQRLTTNHVAERAGISIGSLYQYFDSKEDLLAALIECRGADYARGVGIMVTPLRGSRPDLQALQGQAYPPP